MTADDVFALVRKVREISDEVPIVFYTYYNLVFARGHDDYVKTAKEAGVDGLLVLDLPPEEASEHLEICKKHDLKTVFIVAPTTPASRIPLITSAATGFIYYVSREGVTGERTDMAEGVDEALVGIRAETNLPVVVGFGISNQDQVRGTAKSASGVVVGSAIVKRCADLSAKSPDGWDSFASYMRDLVAGCSLKS
jgi:tryptophan synthase alpha chain